MPMKPADSAAGNMVRANSASRRGRRWLPVAMGVAVVGAIIFGLWPKPVPVETAVAIRGRLRATVNEEGRTRVRNRYMVASPVTGQLRRITLDPGDPVVAGKTVVAVLDSVLPGPLDARSRAAAEARRASAVAGVEKARAAHDFAQTELARFEKLFRDGAIAIQDLDAAKLRAEQATRELRSAEGHLRQVEAELTEFGTDQTVPASVEPRVPVEITAPASGCVLRVFEKSARVVTAGTPLLEVGDPADLEVVIEVLSRDGAAISPGTRVFLEQWGGSAPLEARVRIVEPAAFTKISALGVEEQRVNVIGDIVTPPEQRRGLGDGFRVEARIVMWEGENVLKVPAGALFRRGQEWHVFVLVNGRAELRAVKVGHSSGAEIEIIDGLKDGETVIVYPGDRVREGRRVRPIRI